MAIIKILQLFKKYQINPYKVLGVKKDATKSEIKSQFRKRMKEVRDNYDKRADLCLADDMMLNKKFYKEIEEDIFEFDPHIKDGNILCHYYCIIGDALKLMTLILNEKKNKNLILFKDDSERNLLYISARNGHTNICELLLNLGIYDINDIEYTGSTPLHAAAYYGQKNVVKLLLDYGAKTNIKNNFGNLPKDEAMTQEIKQLLEDVEKDRIGILYQSLLSKNIATKLIPISSQGKIVARKIICKLNNLPKYYDSSEVTKNWITAWHGTKFTSLESIAEVGLKPAGGKSKEGKEIDICVGHIDRDITVNNISHWSEAIFVSPSIFYSAHPAYSKEIFCENESWKVLIEVKVKPNSFNEYKLTVRKENYKFKEGETEMLEYRIEPKNEKDVQVISLTFVKSKVLESMTKFNEANFLKFSIQEGFNDEPEYTTFNQHNLNQIIMKEELNYKPNISIGNKSNKNEQEKDNKTLELELEKLIEFLRVNYCQFPFSYKSYSDNLKDKELLYGVKHIEKLYKNLLQKYGDIDIDYKYVKLLNEIVGNIKFNKKTIQLLNYLIDFIDKERYK